MAHAQSFYGGFLPEITLSYQWNDKIQHTTKLESMHEMYQDQSPSWNYAYEQTDVQTFLVVKLNPFWKIAGGYQYRFKNNGANSHRTIQQAALGQRKTGYQLGHRWRTDQTFYPREAIKWRVRYRLAAEIPLEGQSLDNGEFFLSLSTEPVYAMQVGTSDLETRLTVSMGFFKNRHNKLVAGWDYRLQKLLVKPYQQQLWFKIGWYLIL